MTASNPPTAIHQLCTLGLVKVFGWMDGFPYDKCFVKLSVMSPWATRCLRADENTFWNGFETTFPKKLILWRMPLTGWLLLSVAGTLESLLKQSNGYAHVRWGTFLGVCVCVCVCVCLCGWSLVQHEVRDAVCSVCPSSFPEVSLRQFRSRKLFQSSRKHLLKGVQDNVS